MRSRRSVLLGVALLVCTSLVASACTGESNARRKKADPATQSKRQGRTTGPFNLVLTTGQAIAAQPVALTVERGEALDEAAVAAVVDKFPKFKVVPDDSDDFKRPPESLRRPRVGDTVKVPLGEKSAQKPKPVDDGPLEVVRYQPQGDVVIAPDISVTFNQPMVELATLQQFDQAKVPVKVMPALKGRWRWIGTRTLRFQFEGNVDRLPMATSYTVEVPAGTRSQSGKLLAKAQRWSFQTPPPKVVTFYPDHTNVNKETGRDQSKPKLTVSKTPVFIAIFDQRVDPAAVLATSVLKANGKSVKIRLATAAEVNADDRVRQMSKDATSGRWVAFRPADPLPAGARLAVVLGSKVPSAEGQRVNDERFSFATEVFSALKVTESRCGYFEGCRPDGGFSITFNNALDAKKFDSKLVSISPALSTSIGTSGNVININAHTKRNTKYTVKISKELRDEFGQRLGADKTLTFNVGDASPTIVAYTKPLITTDPTAPKPSLAVTSVGHAKLHVDIYKVSAGDWPAYRRLQERWHGSQTPRVPFAKLAALTVSVDGGGTAMTETSIDLSPYTKDGLGHVVVVVSSATKYGKDDPLLSANLPTMVWAQSTKIGIDALADKADLVAWATRLADGKPLAGVAIRLGGTNQSATTDENGVARVALAKWQYLTATQGADVALLNTYYGDGWLPFPASDSIAGVVFNDRGVYRPGEVVHAKGWVRRIRSSGATVAPLRDGNSVAWSAHDAFGNEIGKGLAPLNTSSGFDVSFKLPAGVALGAGSFEATVNEDGVAGNVGFSLQVQEFRRPEFEVVTRAESAGPHVLTQPLTLAAAAKYFSGGILSSAPVVWQVTSSRGTYSPPNWDAFTFGEARPYWLEGDRFGRGGDRFVARGRFADESVCCFPQPDDQKYATYEGVTDSSGTHYLQLDFNGETPDLPLMISANAATTDVNRQSFGSDMAVLVHPSTLYVGIRSARQYVREGESIEMEAIVTDIDGNVVEGRTVKVTAVRVTQGFVNGEWKTQESDAKHCDITSKSKPTSCAITAGIGGEYKISAVVADDNGGKSRSQITRYVSGHDAIPARDVEEQKATVVPDEEHYKPGDTAELLVISPIASAEGLMAVTSGGATTTTRFTVRDGSAIVKLPIVSKYAHGVTLNFVLAGSSPRVRDDGKVDPKLAAQAAFATASLALHVKPVDKTLQVKASSPQAVLEPGAKATVDVVVQGPDGVPVANADVAVVVVDEAVLSLTNYQLPDPVAAIYQQRDAGGMLELLRRTLVLANPMVFGDESLNRLGYSATRAGLPADRREQSSADGAFGAAKSTALTVNNAVGQNVRTNFNALALFSPSLRTDASGRVQASFDLPDNLTRYRVMAIAAGGPDSFGAGESSLTARKSLQVRPSAPRFANFGDAFELPVVVQNQTNSELSADVVLESSNLSIDSVRGKRVVVPANNRIEVRFPVTAKSAGIARYRISAIAGTNGDSASGSFPVYTPVTTEAFATYGVVDGGAIANPLLTPTGVVAQYGGLEIDTSSTAVQALTDAVVYLENYEYDSVDAYASRVIALTSLRDVFAAFTGTNFPSAAKLDARIRSDIKALERLQNDDGGFGVWERGAPPQPYISVQAAEAFVLAKLGGYPVSEQSRTGALSYLRDIESKFPKEWGTQERHATSAYALHVRNRAGDRDVAKAEALYRSDDALSIDGIAWLWPMVDDPTIDAAITRTLANRAHENAGTATFTAGYTDGANLILGSDRRTDAIVLDALLTKQPTSDLIPKVVAGLVGNQVKGRWNNIQENSFILVALHRYFATFEAQTPAFVARMWLGDTYAAEHSFQGRSTAVQHTLVPMSELGGNPDVVIDKVGTGRLYYRLGLQYAPADLSVPARDEGFVVDRVYEAVNDPSDVRRDDKGVWRIKPGAMVRVRVTMVADTNHTNMALVDALPAGFEALNPALATTPRVPSDTQPIDPAIAMPRYQWAGPWFDHENLRDDRAEAFSAYLYGGTFEYSYVARATTPGTFIAPPAKAEEIYAPEVFGRSSSDRVVIG